MSENKEELFEIATLHGTFKTNKLTPTQLRRKPWVPANPKEVVSFIPGTVVEFKVAPGDIVKEGDILLIYKAMKMDNLMKSEVDGVVKELCIEPGKSVPKGTLLMTFE